MARRKGLTYMNDDYLKLLLQEIKEDIRQIKGDMTVLQEFRWKILTTAVVVSTIFGFAAQFLMSSFINK